MHLDDLKLIDKKWIVVNKSSEQIMGKHGLYATSIHNILFFLTRSSARKFKDKDHSVMKLISYYEVHK